MRTSIANFWADQEGLTTVEYALILSVLIVGLCVTWQPLGHAVVGIAEDTSEAIDPQPKSLGCS